MHNNYDNVQGMQEKDGRQGKQNVEHPLKRKIIDLDSKATPSRWESEADRFGGNGVKKMDDIGIKDVDERKGGREKVRRRNCIRTR